MRISVKALFFLILWSACAEAKFIIWPYYPGLRFERGQDQELEALTSYSTGIGWFTDPLYFSLETEFFKVSTNEGNVSIKREYRDYKLSGGYTLHRIDSWYFLGLAGMGTYQEKVGTRVGGLTDSDTSKQKTLFTAGFEVLFSDLIIPFSVGLGGRFIWGQDLDPTPQPDIHLKLGLQFQ